MELFIKQIWEVLPISGIDDWAAVLSDELEGEEVKPQEKLLISLVGFDCSKNEKRQEGLQVYSKRGINGWCWQCYQAFSLMKRIPGPYSIGKGVKHWQYS